MPSKRGTRSLKAQVIRYIYQFSHRDRQLCESICLSDPDDIIDGVLPITLPFFDTTQVNDIIMKVECAVKELSPERGLVLVNSRGTGAFQR